MKKTTVYLAEDSVDALRRIALATGRPQAELVREAVESYVSKNAPKRVFLSAGSGSSGRKGSSIADDEEDLLWAGANRETGWETS